MTSALFFLLPTRLRAVAVILLPSQVYLAFALGGVSDAIFLPFLIVALWRWDRFGNLDEPSAARWIGPVALACALSVKQITWFLAPFLVAGVYLEAVPQGHKAAVTRAGRYVLFAFGAFLLLNVPFIAWSPSAWANDVLAPLIAPTIPDGQGLVVLSRLMGRGMNLHAYTAMGAILGIAALVLYVGRYRYLKRAAVPLAALIFFVPTRSFDSYMLDMLPAALIGASTVLPAAHRWTTRARRRFDFAVAGCLGTIIFLVGVTAASPSSLAIRVANIQTTGQLQTVSAVRVTVSNREQHPLRVRFAAIIPPENSTTFWNVGGSHGQRVRIPAQATRHFVIEAPSMAAMPPATEAFRIAAYSDSPPSVSVSPLISARRRQWTAYLTPTAIDTPVPLGTTISVRVSLLDGLDNPVVKGGVLVSIGQARYTNRGVEVGDGEIDGRRLGAGATALTAPNGVATFRITIRKASAGPTYFQAWLVQKDGVPFGYSNTLVVRSSR